MKLPPPHPSFEAKKCKILSQLAIPDAEYADASPKGSVDEGIRDLIAEINSRDGLVTTSSCAGRVSVFVEGSKTSKWAPGGEDDKPRPASAVGGKGGGGTWLFVSHDPVDETVLQDDGAVAALFGFDGAGCEEGGGVGEVVSVGESRLIHFKFEPMVCHFVSRLVSHSTNRTIDPSHSYFLSAPRPACPQVRSRCRLPRVRGGQSARLVAEIRRR